MARQIGNPKPWRIETYSPTCGRTSVHKTHRSYQGRCRVFCYRITDITQLTSHTRGSVLDVLDRKDFADSVGLYFYRFADDDQPFVKVGECSSRPITERFRKGWFGRGTDSYIHRQTRNPVTDEDRYKPMYRELLKVSHDNPAYFVFYEMVTEEATPKVDEFIAIEHHVRHFNRSTISPHSVPRYRTGAHLVWHDSAFDEVLKKQFPSGNPYP